MTPNDQIRAVALDDAERFARVTGSAVAVASAAWVYMTCLERGIVCTRKQVSNALRSKSSRPGPARSPKSCPTCGARPCHQRGNQ